VSDQEAGRGIGFEVQRRQRLSHREFTTEYLIPHRPVIVTDAISSWPACSKWTFDFLRQAYGAVSVKVDGEAMSIRELVDRTLASTTERPGPYLRNKLFSELPPDLTADVSPLPCFTRPNWLTSALIPGEARDTMAFLELYIGGEGSSFPVLHFDGLHTHAFIMQVVGRKRFIIYGPEQSPYLYPQSPKYNHSEVANPENADFERFPLFRHAVPTTFVLEAGETLFVPAGWWHTAQILAPCISVSVNTANASNWRAYCGDLMQTIRRTRSPLKAAAWSLHLWGTGLLLRALQFGEGWWPRRGPLPATER
jgi:histone arginine demethylase JMJD6